MTWFRVGGRARCLYRPGDAEELSSFIVRARHEGADVRVLGSGANVLVRDDGVEGVVVRLDQPEFRRVKLSGTTADIGAGVDLLPLSREFCDSGLAGLEWMAGIPSTVGGAVRMNAGGRSGEFGQVVREIEVLGADGAIETWSHDRVGFAYRHTDIEDRVVLSARIELTEDDPARVRKAFDENFAQKREAQPISERSAGCVFKNPVGQSAGALIDRAGLKGARCGGAYVSRRHANFIITEPGAKAADVLHLISVIHDRVLRAFGTELEVEVQVW
jgi:UDP-N-acetylmuramate dehydrogenase